MCYCSSILRGVTAVLLNFWDACREKSASDAPKQLNTTCRLISCMRKVQQSVNFEELLKSIDLQYIQGNIMDINKTKCAQWAGAYGFMWTFI